MVARSKEWVYDYTPAEIVGSNQDGAWKYVSCECCVLSGRGLSDVPITRPDESYPVWCVRVWSRNLTVETQVHKSCRIIKKITLNTVIIKVTDCHYPTYFYKVDVLVKQTLFGARSNRYV